MGERGTEQPGIASTMLRDAAAGLIVLAVVALVVLILLLLPNCRKMEPPERTGAAAKILLSAIEAYRQETGSYPDDATGAASQSSSAPSTEPAAGRIRALWDQLASQQASVRVIQKIPADWTNVEQRLFLDGWGKHFDYQCSGGADGHPVLISAGPDGSFDTAADNMRFDAK